MKNRAFTLIELLVVVAIIGILAAVGVVAYNGYTSNAKKSAITSACKEVIKKFEAEKALCLTKGPMDYAYESARNYGSKYHQMECQTLNNPTYNWSSRFGAIQDYHNSELGMTNLFNKNRPFINLNSNYNLDHNYGSVHLYAQDNPSKVTFYCCLQKPCADSKNIYSKEIIK